MTERILIVEDDEHVRELLGLHIREIGYEPDFAVSGPEGLDLARSHKYALLILDVGLPGLSGVELCRKLRQDDSDLPILILSSRGSEVERVIGLEIGADDYVTKPFSIHELMARIKAQLRRRAFALGADKPGDARSQSSMKFGDLAIDIERREVTLSGKSLGLTAMEFDVVAFLAQHEGRPFTRDELLEQIWGVHAEGYEKNVNTLITRLRKKLGSAAGGGDYIRTYRGVGYAFVNPASSSAALDDADDADEP